VLGSGVEVGWHRSGGGLVDPVGAHPHQRYGGEETPDSVRRPDPVGGRCKEPGSGNSATLRLDLATMGVCAHSGRRLHMGW
jgi:hypothetical protein